MENNRKKNDADSRKNKDMRHLEPHFHMEHFNVNFVLSGINKKNN